MELVFDTVVEIDGRLFAVAGPAGGAAEVMVFDAASKSWTPAPDAVLVSTLMEDGRTPSPELLAEAGLAAS